MDHAERLNRASSWLEALERGLGSHGGNDLIVPYAEVAMAFPSAEPNPLSFEAPLIDREKLRAWAEMHGWVVKPAPEARPQGDTGHPPVRFVRNVA